MAGLRPIELDYFYRRLRERGLTVASIAQRPAWTPQKAASFRAVASAE